MQINPIASDLTGTVDKNDDDDDDHNKDDVDNEDVDDALNHDRLVLLLLLLLVESRRHHTEYRITIIMLNRIYQPNFESQTRTTLALMLFPCVLHTSSVGTFGSIQFNAVALVWKFDGHAGVHVSFRCVLDCRLPGSLFLFLSLSLADYAPFVGEEKKRVRFE